MKHWKYVSSDSAGGGPPYYMSTTRGAEHYIWMPDEVQTQEYSERELKGMQRKGYNYVVHISRTGEEEQQSKFFESLLEAYAFVDDYVSN